MIRTSHIVFVALMAIAPSVYAGSEARDLIAAARQATGGAAWDSVEGLHEQGVLTAGGLAGRYENWVDFKGLRETSSIHLGPASETEGWDGREEWSVDSSKDVRMETSQGSLAAAIQKAYREAYGFFFPSRHRADCKYVGTRAVDGVAYAIVRITPQGAEPFEVWFNPATHLIAREVQISGDEPQAFIFSDWRSVGAARLPFRTIVRTANDSRFDRTFTATHIELPGAISTSRFAPPSEAAEPALWPAGESSVTVPFRLINNHIYVRASINGRPRQNIIFDTGATDILELTHAKALDIRSQGALPVGGIGDKVTAYGFARVRSVSIGGLTLRDQVFGTIDLGSLLKVEDADTAGLVGYEFAKRAVVTIDYARRTLTFTKPADFHPPAGLPAIPFTFHEHAPMVTAAIDGVAGQFELDTGARTGLMVMGPFARKNGLIGKYHAVREATVSYGIGGPERALIARVRALSIGPMTLSAPVADFLTGAGGDASSAHTAGNIGGDLLKRFTVTLDYGHRALWLQPNALAAVPEIFDRSGLWISRAADGTIAVGDVVPGSAASAAGIRVGDRIIAVNGTPAERVAVYQLRQQLKGAPATHIKLLIKRRARELACDLLLANQV